MTKYFGICLSVLTELCRQARLAAWKPERMLEYFVVHLNDMPKAVNTRATTCPQFAKTGQ